jgi:hypothetical protein
MIIERDFDFLNRISKIKEGNNDLASYEYIGRTYRLLNIQYNNGDLIHYLYDQVRRFTSKETRNKNSDLINKYSFCYNNVHMKTFEDRGHDKSIFPNITSDLTEKMRTNANKTLIHNPLKFENKVTTGGDWDFKNKKITINESHKYKVYLFRDRLIRYDVPGNIHYGYFGKAAIWSCDKILYKKLRGAQTHKKTIWNIPPYYGADSVDHEFIKWGIELYKEDRRRPYENIIKKSEKTKKPYYLNRFYKNVSNR